MNKLFYQIKKIIKICFLREKITEDRNTKKVYIMMSADYGNLGDVAITYAQRKFIENNLKEYKVIEITLYDFYRKYLSIKNTLNDKDIITIIGGGNNSDLYIEFEDVRRFIIKNFKKNKIISFPQTMDFKNQKELKKTVKIYSSNDNLYLFAREKKTYEKYKNNFKKNKIFLVPDIVLSLKKYDLERNRENILFCLRNDKEKYISLENEEELIEKVKEKYKNIFFQDTHIGDKKIKIEDREKNLREIWDNFASSKIVVTDRLHGLIFSVITGTPCIALDNSNHKIKETYETWLELNENIYFFEKIVEKDIMKLLNNIQSNKHPKKECNLEKNFESLRNVLIEN